MNNTKKKQIETTMSLEQAKLEWYKINPKNQTHLNLSANDEINVLVKLLAQQNFDGFVKGLQYSGVLVVEK